MAATKKGILLMNLGSPDSTEVKDVTRYLNQFLMDERVIDYPYLLRALLVRGIIVPLRAPKSAAAYKTIWTKDGSPLVVLTRQLEEALQAQVTENVAIAMRYGNPSPQAGFEALLRRDPALEEVILVPLYPHYAMSSYETAVDYAMEIYKQQQYKFKVTTVQPFYQEPHYIDAMAANMQPYLQQEYDHLLFSYHGIPERHIRKSDTTGQHCLKVADCCHVPSAAHATCYRHQVFTTTQKLVEQLGIPAHKYSVSFQSRLGKGWLQPFTDIRLEEMPKQGIKKLLVICPAFVSDCLETLEEIDERGRESFLEAGGESFTMIPCLNTHPLWVKAIAGWIKDYAGGNTALIH
ncbi:MAG TPA: ferrochelatase [Chitinophagaceae bacterium]|nr:ferrochelatase [Chitinophagaceae bacterium]